MRHEVQWEDFKSNSAENTLYKLSDLHVCLKSRLLFHLFTSDTKAGGFQGSTTQQGLLIVAHLPNF